MADVSDEVIDRQSPPDQENARSKGRTPGRAKGKIGCDAELTAD